MKADGFATKHVKAEVNVGSLLQPSPGNLDRNTQIVATLGPASLEEEMLDKMIKAGVNVFRLNSSHRRPGQFEALVPLIRSLAKSNGREVKILGDLQGPKFRCGTVAGEAMQLEVGSNLVVCLMESDSDDSVPGRMTLADTTEQSAMIKGLEVGMPVLLDDGNMALKVISRETPTSVTCEVVVGGTLKSRKGINVPELQIECSALTVKDIEDAKFLLGLRNAEGGCDVDYIALSFVQKREDIQELKDLMVEQGITQGPMIIPKIEKPAAIKNIDEILEASDGLMVARGDLGVELGLHRVPFAQKMLIRKANEAGKFVITATQMMESMITAAVPTRAEVSDVANAVFDGTDAVMLSGESAVGVNPAGVIEFMGLVAAEAESHLEDVSPSF